MTTYHVVTGGDNLMLRKGRGTNTQILARLPNGTNVDLIEPDAVNNWFHVNVEVDGETLDGFVFGDFIRPGALNGDAQDVVFANGTLGMNLPLLAFYGTHGAPNGINVAIWQSQREILKQLHVKAVRLFVRHRAVDDYIDRLHATLKTLDEAGMKAILCLIDVFSNIGCNLKTDDTFYDMATSAGNKLHPRYYAQKAYAVDGGYLDYVKQVVSAMSNHKNVLYWEIGNELTANVIGQATTRELSNAFLDFARSTAQTIRKADPKAKVSTGLVNTTHVAPTDGSMSREDYAFKLYGLFDAVSLHYYRDDKAEDQIEVDIAVARQRGLPVYIGEIGGTAVDNDSRAGFFKDQIRKAKNERKISLVMPWDMGSPLSKGFGGERGLAWRHNDINDVLKVLENPD